MKRSYARHQGWTVRPKPIVLGPRVTLPAAGAISCAGCGDFRGTFERTPMGTHVHRNQVCRSAGLRNWFIARGLIAE